MKKFTFFLLASFYFCNICLAQWNQTNGPIGGTINCFTHNSVNSTVFCGSQGTGVYFSATNGSTWTKINNGLTNLNVKSLKYYGSSLFAGTEAGLFKSNDNGVTWTIVGGGLPSDIRVNEILFIGSNYYLGTNLGVYKSIDTGNSWTSFNVNLSNTNINSLTYNGNYLFVATPIGNYKSLISSSNWSACNSGISGLYIYSIVSSGTSLYLSNYNNVYKSINDGATWTIVFTATHWARNVTKLFVNGIDLWAGLSGFGAMKSTNAGSTWVDQYVPGALEPVYGIYGIGSTIFLGSHSTGIHKSVNNGNNWTIENNGIINTVVNTMCYTGTNIVNGNDSKYSISYSADSGNSYVSSNAFYGHQGMKYGGGIIYTGYSYGGAMQSYNDGANWQSLGIGLPGSTVYSFFNENLAFNFKYAATDLGVYRSSDGGNTWIEKNNGLNSNEVHSIWASDYTVVSGTNGGIYFSSDNAQNWTLTNCYDQATCFAKTVTKLFAGTSNGLWYSIDNGQNWYSVSSFTYSNIVDILIFNTDIFIATTYDGVIRSSDNGLSWSTVNDGFLRPNVLCLASDNVYLYAGTNGDGIFKIDPSTIKVGCSVSAASLAPSMCIGDVLPDITHTTTGATGISNSGASGANGLPLGVSATWLGNTITISGSPTTTIGSQFNYSIPLIGGCGATSATGTITVNPKTTPTFTQLAAVCSGATIASLPTTSTNGVTGTWSPAINNTTTTTYTFTPTAGTCANTTTMTISVNPIVTPTFTQVPSVCSGTAISVLPTTSTDGITGTWSPAINNTTTTTYTFTPTAGQCATSATQTITITTPKVTSEISFVAPVAALPNVTIGTQVWTNKNLDVTTYRDGTPIPQVTDPTQWANLTTGAWCYYNNDPANGAVYGKLYNWYAVAGIHDNDPNTPNKILAPLGWHVSSEAEWSIITTFLGGSVAGGNMKEVGTSHWDSPNTGATNSSGFTALPGGNRFSNGPFYPTISTAAIWWTSSEYANSNTIAWGHYMAYNASYAPGTADYKTRGAYVRLVKD
jgi:uncharacterized protein (TIGR02145 family)